jgi:hypothetical protein
MTYSNVVSRLQPAAHMYRSLLADLSAASQAMQTGQRAVFEAKTAATLDKLNAIIQAWAKLNPSIR